MNKPISPSFPEGIPCRTLEQARADRAASLRQFTQNCPWCGSEPGLAVKQAGFWLVGCDADECSINPQAGSRISVEDAWRRWNTRALREGE